MNYKIYRLFLIFFACSVLFMVTACPSKFISTEDIINVQVLKTSKYVNNKNEIILLISEKTANKMVIERAVSPYREFKVLEVPIGKYLSMTSQKYFTHLQGKTTKVISVLPDNIPDNKTILELQVDKIGEELFTSRDLIASRSELDLKIIVHKNKFKSKPKTYSSRTLKSLPTENVHFMDHKNRRRENIIVPILKALQQVEKDI
ncbi:hypothetical protein MNBD_DELTA01-566 [hydrothermal vent metagenome]|uniref:Lipoprotein n=1 Tax=hydrothermal vent metagenome TaxID=652676 RepID=A0A3B0R5L4_9ZZZZ